MYRPTEFTSELTKLKRPRHGGKSHELAIDTTTVSVCMSAFRRFRMKTKIYLRKSNLGLQQRLPCAPNTPQKAYVKSQISNIPRTMTVQKSMSESAIRVRGVQSGKVECTSFGSARALVFVIFAYHDAFGLRASDVETKNDDRWPLFTLLDGWAGATRSGHLINCYIFNFFLNVGLNVLNTILLNIWRQLTTGCQPIRSMFPFRNGIPN